MQNQGMNRNTVCKWASGLITGQNKAMWVMSCKYVCVVVRAHGSKAAFWCSFYFCQSYATFAVWWGNRDGQHCIRFVRLLAAKGRIAERRVQKERKSVVFNEKKRSDNCQKWPRILPILSTLVHQCRMLAAHWYPWWYLFTVFSNKQRNKKTSQKLAYHQPSTFICYCASEAV